METNRIVTLEDTQRIVSNLEENLSNAQFRKLAENLGMIAKICDLDNVSILKEESGEITLLYSSEHRWRGTSHRELIRHFLLNIWFNHSNVNVTKLMQACKAIDFKMVAEHADAYYETVKVPITLEKMLPKNWMYVGKIGYDPANVLGKGANNTIVYAGKFENMRDVAVKKIFIDFYDFEKVQNEINLLEKHGYDGHENVIRFIGHEIVKGDQPIFLIALELCQYSLYDWIQPNTIIESKIRGCIRNIDILKQCTAGLVYLHGHNIIHRDIKPENILLKVMEQTVIVKISDFGISRMIPDGKRSITNYTGSGSDGWMAPEILKLRSKGVQSIKLTKETDIYSLGCVFFYTWCAGRHLFGEPLLLRNVNIMENKVNFVEFSEFALEDKFLPGAAQLISLMTAQEASERPSAFDVSKHPLFWSSDTKLKFVITVSDLTMSNQNDEDVKTFVRIFENVPYSDLTSTKFSRFEAFCTILDNAERDWSNLICKELKLKLIASGRYKNLGKSLVQLLRVIRNLHNHFWDQDDDVRSLLGNPPNLFLEYWQNRMPNLIFVVWYTILKIRVHPALSEFFTSYTTYANSDLFNMSSVFRGSNSPIMDFQK